MALALRSRLVYFFGLLFFITLSAFATSAQVQPRITEAIDNNHRVTLGGNVHPLARPEFDRGSAGNGQPMTHMLLLLKRSDEQEAALLNLLEQQQDKSSPNYQAWLTPESFGASYGPAVADIEAITGWLGSQGFAIEKVYSGKTIIEFSGNAGQLQQAFGTEIHKYEVAGKSYMANAQNPQIPAALAPVVAGIVSLNNFPRISHALVLGIARKVQGKRGLQPLFTFPLPNGNGTFYGLGPGDFATIYNSKSLIAGGNDGTGQTIAIVGETNIKVQDIISFRSMFGLPSTFTASNVILNGEDPGITSTGEETEADLDVQWSGAAAPGATIKFVVSASTPASAGIDLSALYIIEHNLAGVMSESYGDCEQNLGSAGNAFYNALWEQAAAQGITAILSAGDGGSAGCDDFTLGTPATKGLAVSGMASTPFNVSVGGTDFDQRSDPALYWSVTNNTQTGTSALGYIPEIPWNQNCAQIGLTGCGANAPSGSVNIVAGSGGASTVYGKPAWQMGVTGMPNDSHRDQPDVSLFASAGFSGTGYIVCQQDQVGAQTCDLTAPNGADFLVVGGTSASTPAFAGTMALVNQYQGAHGGSNRQGNANYVLYALAKKSGASCTSSTMEAASCVFNDITKGSSDLPTGGVGIGTNSVACTGGTPNCSAAVATTNGVLVDPAHPTTEAWTVTPGYDTATGLGTVNIGNLVAKWSSVSTVATTTTLTLNPLTGITHGTNENVAVTVNVQPTSGTASGNVSLIAKFADGTTQGLDQFTLTNGTVSNQKTQSLPGGSYSVYAHYAGDGTNAPSDSAPVSVTVSPESSQTFIVIPTFDVSGSQTSGNATTITYGSNYIIRMFVADKNAATNPAGPPSPTCYQEYVKDAQLICPSGSVTLTANGNPLDGGTYSLNIAGYTRDLSPSLNGGTYSLIANYGGDNSYQASTSATTTFTVTPATTQTQINSAQTTVLLGQPVPLDATISANVFGNPVSPTGTVAFYDGNTLLTGTESYSAAYSTYYASFSTSLSQGMRSITARYSGDGNYGPSTSSVLTVDVLYPTAITQSESSNNINLGQSITVTGKVMSNAKSPAMTGQVQLLSYSSTFTNVVTTPGTDANGNQMLTVTGTTTPQATGYVGVSYLGDANYGQSISNGDQVVVNIPDFSLPSSTTISAVAGQTGTATIQVTPASNIPSTVNLAVQGTIPAGMMFTLSQTNVSLNGTAVPVTLTMTTTGTNGVQSNIRRAQIKKSGFFSISRPTWWSISALCLFIGIYLFGMRGRQKRFRAAFLVLMLGVVSFALGCGGGGTSSGGGGGNGGGGAGPYATTTSVSTSAAKIAQSNSVTFTATVTSKGSPTGTVYFMLNGNFLNSAPLVAGTATLPIAIPNIGTYALTAQYQGDSNNLTSTSSPVTQVISGNASLVITGNTSNLSHETILTVTLQ